MTLNSNPSKKKTEDYFGKMLFVLKAVGVSLDENNSMAYRIYSSVVLIIFGVLYSILDSTELFRQDVDSYTGILMYDIPMSLCIYAKKQFLTIPVPFLTAAVKSWVLIRKRRQFQKLLVKLHQEPFVPNSDRGGETEEKLLNECLWITAAQTYAYWVLGIISLSSGIMVAVVSRIRSDDYHDWKFAYGPFTILNATYSPNYEICMIYQNISAVYIAMRFMTVDLLAASLLAHVCFQFKVLQNNMKLLVANSYEEMLKETKTAGIITVGKNLVLTEAEVSTIPWRYLKKHLARAVNYHLAIIGVVDELERLLSSLLLTVFVSTLAMLCLLVYNTSLLSLSDPEILTVGAGVLCACAQVLTVCFWGEQVLFESQQVAKAAYDTNFVGSDLRFQKSLALIIRRAQSPAYITAGKFAIICLATFAWIMRTSYSAFMVLRNMNQ